jgi:hypothetical protein
MEQTPVGWLVHVEHMSKIIQTWNLIHKLMFGYNRYMKKIKVFLLFFDKD